MATVLGMTPQGQFVGINVGEALITRPWELVSGKEIIVKILTTIAIIIATLGVALIGLIVMACINACKVKVTQIKPEMPLELRNAFLYLAQKLLDQVPNSSKGEVIVQLSQLDNNVYRNTKTEELVKVLLSVTDKITKVTVPITVGNQLSQNLAKAREYSRTADGKALPGGSEKIHPSVIAVNVEAVKSVTDVMMQLSGLKQPSEDFKALLEKIIYVISNPTRLTKIEQIELLRSFFLALMSVGGRLGEVYLPEMNSFLEKIDFDPIYTAAAKKNHPQLQITFFIQIVVKLTHDHFMKIDVLQKIWQQEKAVELVGQEVVDFYKELYSYSGVERMLKEEPAKRKQQFSQFMPQGNDLQQIEGIVRLALADGTTSV